MTKRYWSWMPWMRWFCPLSILLWYSKRTFGRSHVWYQDGECQLELRPRFCECDQIVCKCKNGARLANEALKKVR